jgi:hypothetical protein
MALVHATICYHMFYMEKWEIPLNLGVTANQMKSYCGDNNTGMSHPKEVISLSSYKPFSFGEQEEAAQPYNLLKNMHPSATAPPSQIMNFLG